MGASKLWLAGWQPVLQIKHPRAQSSHGLLYLYGCFCSMAAELCLQQRLHGPQSHSHFRKSVYPDWGCSPVEGKLSIFKVSCPISSNTRVHTTEKFVPKVQRWYIGLYCSPQQTCGVRRRETQSPTIQGTGLIKGAIVDAEVHHPARL